MRTWKSLALASRLPWKEPSSTVTENMTLAHWPKRLRKSPFLGYPSDPARSVLAPAKVSSVPLLLGIILPESQTRSPWATQTRNGVNYFARRLSLHKAHPRLCPPHRCLHPTQEARPAPSARSSGFPSSSPAVGGGEGAVRGNFCDSIPSLSL